ncbi:MAG: radical SAM protein [Proteobacteria bacterium]|nr:radical SAM protein [Pseudomonadota bacterium]
MFLIEVTSYCNSSCLFCLRRLLENRDAGGMTAPDPVKLNEHMDWNLFVRILKEVFDYNQANQAPIRILDLHGLGEPLLWPHYKQGIQLVRRLGFHTQLITNGTLLDEAMIDFLLDHITYKLKVSINGVSDHTLLEVTRNPKSKTVNANCRLLIEKIRRTGRKPHLLAFGYVICPENRHEVEWFHRLWHKDRDIVLPYSVEAIDFSLDKMPDLEDTRGSCPRKLTPANFNVLVDGAVQPCCYTNRIALGNLAESSLEEIINGPAYRRLLDLDKKGRLGEEAVCNATCLAGARAGRSTRPESLDPAQSLSPARAAGGRRITV